MMVIFKSEISATATGVSSGMKSGSVEAYTFTFPLMRGAISHLTIQFPTLFSSHTTDICGAVPPQEGSNTASASKFNRFLYIIRKLSKCRLQQIYSFSPQIIQRAGRFDSEKAKANDVPMKVWSSLQKGKTVDWEGKTYTPDMVLGPARKGLKVTYCTDTRPVPTIVEHAKKADLFICEGMYGEPEMVSKAKENRHMMFTEAAQLAKEAEVSELWLTHYSPSLIRPDDFMEPVRKIFPAAKPGKDRKSAYLTFEKKENE